MGWNGRKLALLIGAAWKGYSADDGIAQDLDGMSAALIARGWNREEIRALPWDNPRNQAIHGRPIQKSELGSFLSEAGRVAGERKIERLFIHYSGHGYRPPKARETDHVCLALSDDVFIDKRRGAACMTYDEMFRFLRLPSSVQVVLLHDG